MFHLQNIVVLVQLSLTLKCFVLCSETSSPEKYLQPRNFNPHPYQRTNEDADTGETTSRYIQRIAARHNQVFGRKGPVTFPNDGKPPPRTPLIVTSRPLVEDIAKSEHGDNAIVTPKPPSAAAIESIQRIAAEDYRDTVLSANNENSNYYQAANLYPIRGNNVRHQTYSGYLNQIFGNGPSNPAVSSYPTPSNSIVDYQSNPYDSLRIVPAKYNQHASVLYPSRNNNYTILGAGHPSHLELYRKSQFAAVGPRPGYQNVEVNTLAPPAYDPVDKYDNQLNIRKAKLNPSWKHHETNTVENLPEDDDGDDGDYYNDNNEEKQYAFSYSVKDHETGDDFSHSQHHIGSATKGEYRVKLPDGRMQIVSYTADNGGYKADVRYEEDPETTTKKYEEPVKPIYQHQNNIIQKDYRRKYIPHKSVTLGRIVVPSQDEADYQDVDYNNNYNEVSSTKAPYIYQSYVTEPVKEVLITSKPGYLYTPTPTRLYNSQYLQQDRRYLPNVTPSPNAYLFASSPTYSPLAEESQHHNVYSTTTNDPQEASKTYSHFYNAESVKFVSTTPKYDDFKKAYFKSTTGTPLRSDILDNGSGLSTAEPETIRNYNQLATPGVVHIEPRPKKTVNYTTLAPLLYNSILANSITSTTPRPLSTSNIISSTASPINAKDANQGAGSFGGLDIRKYFTFTKRETS